LGFTEFREGGGNIRAIVSNPAQHWRARRVMLDLRKMQNEKDFSVAALSNAQGAETA
jgi:hypothetical protein